MVPEKAIPGMPSFAAAVAAPTVPEAQTVAPRFAVMLLEVGAEGYGFLLPPTLGPDTAISGLSPK